MACCKSCQQLTVTMPSFLLMPAMNNHCWSTATRLQHAWIKYPTWRIMKRLRCWIHWGREQPDSANCQPGFSGLQCRSSAVQLPMCSTCRCWSQLYQASGNKHVSGLFQKLQLHNRPWTIGPYPSRQWFLALVY